MRRVQKGFSLLELAMVVTIGMIITAIALPAVKRTITSYQLDSSGKAVASMLQEVRMAAVKANTPYYAQYNPPGVATVGPGVVIAVPAVNAAANPWNYDSRVNPTVGIAGNVTFQTVSPAAGGPPDHSQLDNALGIPAGSAQTSGVIGFSTRGRPCVQAAAGNPWVCNSGAWGFEWFMQNSISQGWEAVTVSPAGRIKSWRLTSTDGSCGFPACWQ